MTDPIDQPESSRRGGLSGPNKLSVKRQLYHAGRVCPFYRKSDDGTTTSDSWENDFYTDGNTDGTKDSGDTGATWEYIGEVIAYRKYHDENEPEEDGRGTYPKDDAVLTVLTDTPLKQGDRLKYAGEIYELTADTQYGIITEWEVRPVNSGQG